MIKEGLFEQFPMEAVFGMHNWPGGEVGKFAVSAGPVMASSNEFKITIRGKGSHAALPHNGIDPVPIACQMVQAFQTIISRNKKPIDAGVISVTMIHAGYAGAWSGGLYLFLYGIVVLFALVRNALAVPYSWLVRPRFIVYAWMPVEVYLWRGTLDPLLWALAVLLAAKAVSAFVHIRRRL